MILKTLNILILILRLSSSFFDGHHTLREILFLSVIANETALCETLVSKVMCTVHGIELLLSVEVEELLFMA